jgi:diguanylate cyclase (GGDEF)-like protein
MVNNFAILDEYFNVVSANPDFFKLMGASNFSSFLKAIHPEDRDLLVNSRHKLAKDDTTALYLRVKGASGAYHDMYAILSHVKVKDKDDQNRVSLEMVDIRKNISQLRELEHENYVLRRLAIMHNCVVFTYNPQIDEFREFTIDKNRNFDVFKGSLDEWFEDFQKRNAIHPDYKDTLKQLYLDIQSCDLNFEHELVANLNGKDNKTFKVRGRVDYINNTYPLLVGEFYSEISGFLNSTSLYNKEPMTGLFDKPSIIKYAKDKIAESGEKNVVIAMIDMDNFKSVNDTLGHSVGDKVIIRFAEILSSIIGSYGAVGRYGGDEFMAVITDFNDENGIRTFFRSIRTTVQTEFDRINGSDVSVTCSIGSANYPVDGDDFYKVFELADTCVYIAKEYGKNRYVFYCDKVQDVIENDTMLWEGRNSRAAKHDDITFRLSSMLFTDGGAVVEDVLEKLGLYFNLNCINIYCGEEMKLIHGWDSSGNKPEEHCAKYALEEDYVKRFALNNIFRIDNLRKIEVLNPTAYTALLNRNVDRAIQYIVKQDDKPVALISYEQKVPATHYWHENEVNTYSLVSRLLGQMIIKTDVNKEGNY